MPDEKQTGAGTARSLSKADTRLFLTLEVCGARKDATRYMDILKLSIEGDVMFIDAMWSLKKTKVPQLTIHEVCVEDASVQQ